jgi:Flp pilus assembly pilin Flp
VASGGSAARPPDKEHLEMKSALNRFVRNDQGLETIEYAIVAGLIVVGVIAAVTAIGIWVANKWEAIKTALGA